MSSPSRSTRDVLLGTVIDIVAGRTDLPSLSRCEAAGEDRAVLPTPGMLSQHLDRIGLAGLAVAEQRRSRDAGRGSGLPMEAERALLPSYHRVGLHTTLVLESARRALEALEDAGVPALLFKGAALCRAGVYEDPGARFLEDADVLVRPDQAERAVVALTRAGFEAWEPWEPRRMTWSSSLTFSDGSAPGRVAPPLDLHWATPYARLRQAGPWGPDPLWEGACGGIPAPEAHFAVLSEHVLKHLRVVVHVRGIADLVRLLVRVGDGRTLAAQAASRGTLPGLRVMLAFLRDVVGVGLPESVAERVGVPKRLPGAARRRLRASRVFGSGGAAEARVEGLIADWWLLGNWRSSLSEIGRVLVPTGRWLEHRYADHGTGPRRRIRYLRELTEWALRNGPSPLSPNQDVGV